MYTFLSNDWSGLLVSMAAFAMGYGLFFIGRRAGMLPVRLPLLSLGGLLLLLGFVLTLTSAWHGISVARMWATHPAPGTKVDVGGYDMHYLAEGKNNGNPTIVFVPGGHSSGYNFYNYHKIFRKETRSMLFDRPATGWSDAGPFPRSSYREAEEFHTLLNKAGETAPVVLVGHSYGGLFAVIYAMRYPEKVAGVVLLDPGLAELYENPTAAFFLRQMAQSTFQQSLLTTFGIPYNLQSKATQDAIAVTLKYYERELADVWDEVAATNLPAMNGYGSASIFSEINDPGFFTTGLIRPGALNGIPVSCVTYLGGTDLEGQAAIDFVLDIRPDLDVEGAKGQISGLRSTRKQILTLSDRIQTYSVPAGASHNFPYEKPDFVTALVRDMLHRVNDPTAQAVLGADLPHGLATDTARFR